MKDKKEELKDRIKELENELYKIARAVSDTSYKLAYGAMKSGDEKLSEVAKTFLSYKDQTELIAADIESAKKELRDILIDEASSKIVEMIMNGIESKEER